MQAWFLVLISLQFLIILLHDLVEVPGWSHTSQMQAVLGKRKLWAATVANSVFPGVAVAFAVYFWNRPKPLFVTRYWMIYCAVTAVSAIAMWYLPYFLGATPAKKNEYLRFYEGTRQILPARGDNPRPNLLHVLFHIVFVATLILACTHACSQGLTATESPILRHKKATRIRWPFLVEFVWLRLLSSSCTSP
jgi:hypothetical protein